jgi:hypothetical protein
LVPAPTDPRTRRTWRPGTREVGADKIEVIAWYTVVALALSSAPMRAGYQQVRRGVDRALGTLLIAVGVRVAFETRWIDACVKWIRTMYARNKAVHAASNPSWRQSLNDALLAW